MRFNDLSEKQKQVSRVLASEDFYFFTRYMFLAKRNTSWRKNWHHKVICDALDRVYRGEVKRLIIMMPPRYSKTEIAVVNWIAWCIGKNPSCQFIHTSYATPLALNNSSNARDLTKHEEYAQVFPDLELSKASDSKGDWKTTKGGTVYATGSGGSITGFGAGSLDSGFGGAIIIDDPHKPSEIHSETIRTGVIDWFQNTLESRVNSPDTPIIVIMQRLHENDLAGWLERGGNGEEWEVLKIPVLNENNEPLWPEKHNIEKLEMMRQANRYVFNSQYMQSPSSIGGEIIKGQWFKRYQVPPRFKRVIIAGDTAQKIKQHNDYSVFIVAGLGTDGGVYIIDLIRGKWEAPELEQKLKDIWHKYNSIHRLQGVYIEDKSSGTGLIQNIQRAQMIPIKGVQVDADKYTRVLSIQGYIESGYVYIPNDAHWITDLIDECEKFTATDSHAHDDQVDTLVMALRELLGNNASILDIL